MRTLRTGQDWEELREAVDNGTAERARGGPNPFHPRGKCGQGSVSDTWLGPRQVDNRAGQAMSWGLTINTSFPGTPSPHSLAEVGTVLGSLWAPLSQKSFSDTAWRS